MNIKNQEAYDLASSLAKEEGKSITQVVLEALQDRKRKLESNAREKKIRATVKELQALMAGEKLDIEDLYDPTTGLPR